MQLVLDSHRWVPLPAVGFPATTIGEESQEDVTPPSYLMEHPPLAVFVNGMSDICFIYCEIVFQVFPENLSYIFENETTLFIYEEGRLQRVD